MEEEIVLPFISLGTALSKNPSANSEIPIFNQAEERKPDAERRTYIMTYTRHIMRPLLLITNRVERMSILFEMVEKPEILHCESSLWRQDIDAELFRAWSVAF